MKEGIWSCVRRLMCTEICRKVGQNGTILKHCNEIFQNEKETGEDKSSHRDNRHSIIRRPHYIIFTLILWNGSHGKFWGYLFFLTKRKKKEEERNGTKKTKIQNISEKNPVTVSSIEPVGYQRRCHHLFWKYRHNNVRGHRRQPCWHDRKWTFQWAHQLLNSVSRSGAPSDSSHHSSNKRLSKEEGGPRWLDTSYFPLNTLSSAVFCASSGVISLLLSRFDSISMFLKDRTAITATVRSPISVFPSESPSLHLSVCTSAAFKEKDSARSPAALRSGHCRHFSPWLPTWLLSYLKRETIVSQVNVTRVQNSEKDNHVVPQRNVSSTAVQYAETTDTRRPNKVVNI